MRRRGLQILDLTSSHLFADGIRSALYQFGLPRLRSAGRSMGLGVASDHTPVCAARKSSVFTSLPGAILRGSRGLRREEREEIVDAYA